MGKNVVVFGGRDFMDFQRTEKRLDTLAEVEDIDAIVCGMAKGADNMGKMWAHDHGVPVIEMPAEWDKHGRRAGYLRNEEMAKISHIGVGFWDGESRGTGHMVNICRNLGLDLRINRYATWLQTCQISQFAQFPKSHIKVNIARKDIGSEGILHRPVLAPSQELFSWYLAHRNEPDWFDTYRKMWDDEHIYNGPYHDKIEEIAQAIRMGANVMLGCFCSSYEQCHRRLVAHDIAMVFPRLSNMTLKVHNL